MQNTRNYGHPPYHIAVIHGGPGAAGEMQPVALELQKEFSILEPMQTATTLQGQVDELAGILQTHASPPLTLAGFSWGAWLSWITAAQYPQMVKKLILIGSGPFDVNYVDEILDNRLKRLSFSQKAEYLTILEALSDPFLLDSSEMFARLGQLTAKADHVDPIEGFDEPLMEDNPYYSVLEEAMEMRENGELLDLGDRIECPVVAIHGEDDPHPVAGVEEPLKKLLKDFRFIRLSRCGHKPWIERHAREAFYDHLRTEFTST